MLDIKYIRENSDQIKKAIQDKRIELDLDRLLELDKKRRELIIEVENLQRERNEFSEKVHQTTTPEDRQSYIEKSQKVKQRIEEMEPGLKEITEAFNELMVKVPNIPSLDTPVGASEDDNVEVFVGGKKPEFDFTVKDHIEIGKQLDILDLERGSKVSGYRGYYLKNEGAILVMALMMYAVNKMISKGYKLMIPPTLVKEFALFGSGYFKGAEYDGDVDEIYQVATSDKEMTGEKSKDKKFLVGTAEPSLLAYYSGEVLNEEDLPMKIAGYSQCYRSEIGSYGKDTRGMYRVHEFMKVEQVVIAPQDIELTEKLQQEMIEISKEMHEELGFYYRVIQICTGDLGAGKYKQFDLETWVPGLNRWAETGSASNFLSWQAKRLSVRYKSKDNQVKEVYMLNNTALPTPRVFIAILENFQRKDGSVKIPDVLVPYTGFGEIKPKS